MRSLRTSLGRLPPAVLSAVCLGAAARVSAAQDPPPPPREEPAHEPDGGINGMSLEELLNLEVSVASRHGERLRDVPAAVYVLTGDEIRRAGHTSIQEALRMVPGFHVAQWKSSGWDVTARGFTGSLSSINESFANQLLLFIDGVCAFSPAMAGIWWPLYDIPIEDIDRIEIIRGPAGTLWGTNAMNGVVNVVTKHPRDTVGGRLTGLVSGWEQSLGVEQGGQAGDRGHYRAYASYDHHDGLPDSNGDHFPEEWWIGSAGMRADWDLGENGRTTFVTHMWTSEFGEDPVDLTIMGLPPFDDTPKNGGYALGSWEFGSSGDVQRLQGWYSIDHQKQVNLEMDVQSADLEYSRHTRIAEAHLLTWGLGYRCAQTNLESDNGFNDFDPEFRRSNSARVFAQDELSLPKLSSKLIVGAQLENADLGGFSVQPNLHWMWNLAAQTSIWAGISRAVRTPSREEVDSLGFNDPTLPPVFTGNKDFDNEKVLAYELGVRSNLTQRIYLDVATFYNEYEDLQTFEFDQAGLVTYGNEAHAKAFGAEVALDLDLTEKWRVRSTWTYFDMDFESSSNAAGAPIDDKDGLVPKNHGSLRSYYDLGDHWELDGALYYSDVLPFWDNPSILRVDARLGWQPTSHLRLSIGVQNAQEEQHPETGENITTFGSEVRRNFYFSLNANY